jgi:hypothetical protein
LSPNAESVVRAARAISQLPPPYRLVANIALIPMRVEAKALRQVVPEIVAKGRLPICVMYARYLRGTCGPDSREVTPPKPGHHLYDEVAVAISMGGRRLRHVCFAPLWVDCLETTPIELGWHYGFDKRPAEIRHTGASDLRVVARYSGSSVFELVCRRRVNLPTGISGLLEPFAQLQAIFPSTQSSAKISLTRMGKAQVLQLRSLRIPGLALCRQPTLSNHLGLWFEEATLRLENPVRKGSHLRWPGS